jgi:uncharacterized repeat protein (TIGR02543 family)
MKKTRFFTVIVAVVMLSVSLTACSNSSKTLNNYIENSNTTETITETETLNYAFCRFVSSEIEDAETGGRYYSFDGKYDGLSAQLYKGGGTIIGQAVQTVIKGTYGTEVTAIAANGYEFVKWSDGLTTPSRKDMSTYHIDTVDSSNYNRKINQVYPLFAKKHTISFRSMTGGYIIGECTQTIVTGKSGTELTAVANTGYIFTGWYCEDATYGDVAPGSLSGRISTSNTIQYDPFKYGVPHNGRYIVATFVEKLN